MFTEVNTNTVGTTIVNTLFYAGVDRASYEMVRPKIWKANRTMVTVLSSIASILIFAMVISSFYSKGIMQNRIVYELGLVMSLIVMILSLTIAKKWHWLATFLVYASYSIYYIYGILIGAITDPTGKTVTFMVMLVFMPTLFIDRPIHVFIVTTVYNAVFIVLCLMNKTGDVLSVDTMDAVIFGILGIASGTVVNHMKVRGYVSEAMTKEISRTDQLTKMNNQNSFIFDKHRIPGKCDHSLACVYVDANGLHKMNNEHGHDEGDRMLQHVAEQIQSCFGNRHTYRTGGDEFVAFIIDPNREELIGNIRKLVQLVEDAKYSVAIGYEISEINYHFSIDNLIKAAELRMQEDKEIYHEKYGR